MLHPILLLRKNRIVVQGRLQKLHLLTLRNLAQLLEFHRTHQVLWNSISDFEKRWEKPVVRETCLITLSSLATAATDSGIPIPRFTIAFGCNSSIALRAIILRGPISSGGTDSSGTRISPL